VTTSSTKLRRRGPPPCFYLRNADNRRLLDRLTRGTPAVGAAKLLHDALEKEVEEKC
jgi:hypothetical protein